MANGICVNIFDEMCCGGNYHHHHNQHYHSKSKMTVLLGCVEVLIVGLQMAEEASSGTTNVLAVWALMGGARSGICESLCGGGSLASN